MLLIIAIGTAIVVPNLAFAPAPTLDDEARQLQQTLRHAAEEAQASGRPLRWQATRRGWHVDTFDAQGRWQPGTTASLAAHALPRSLEIRAVRRSGFSLQPTTSGMADAGVDTPAPVGTCIFYPDGTLTMADIELARIDGGADGRRTLFLRPGSVHIGKEPAP